MVDLKMAKAKMVSENGGGGGSGAPMQGVSAEIGDLSIVVARFCVFRKLRGKKGGWEL